MQLVGLFVFTLVLSNYVFADSLPTIVNEVRQIYVPFANRSGKEFEIKVDAKDSSSSASAKVHGKKWTVILAQGLIDHPRLTSDSLRMTICHELGHILGGAPRKNVPFDWDGDFAPDGLSFMSSEGQADYYASKICFRQLVQGQNHRAELQSQTVPAIVEQSCNATYGSQSAESLICQRAALAGNHFLQLDFHASISFLTPDHSPSANLIQDTYPNRQCRLDTFFAGALCVESSPLALDFYEDSRNNCLQAKGQRPSCWHP